MTDYTIEDALKFKHCLKELEVFNAKRTVALANRDYSGAMRHEESMLACERDLNRLEDKSISFFAEELASPSDILGTDVIYKEKVKKLYESMVKDKELRKGRFVNF
jgi:hypothetical protein